MRVFVSFHSKIQIGTIHRPVNLKGGPMPKVMVLKTSNSIKDTNELIEVKIRKNFPESWLFEGFSVQDNDTEMYVDIFCVMLKLLSTSSMYALGSITFCRQIFVFFF